MAITYRLTDGTTTLNLVGSTYTARRSTVDFQQPDPRALSFNSITGHRIASPHGHRRVFNALRVKAATLSALVTALGDLSDALDKARDWARHGVGNRWRLEYDPGSGATYELTVRDGAFNQPPQARNLTNLRTTDPYVADGELVLDCDAGWLEASETIENHAADPSFEVAGTALADWTELIQVGLTATTSRVTSQKKFGKASLEIDITGSTDVNSAFRYQDITVTAGQVYSLSVWYHLLSSVDTRYRFLGEWYTAASAFISSPFDAQGTIGATTTAFTQLTQANLTAPGAAAKLRVYLGLKVSTVGGTGKIYWDGLLMVNAAALPKAFVSGRSLANHNDDDGQAHISYVDIHPVGGDMPALVQVKYAENEAHDGVVLGVRHATRQYDALAKLNHEGEDFATWDREPADATASAGVYGRKALAVNRKGDANANGIVSPVTISSFAAPAETDMLVAVACWRGNVTSTGVTWKAVGGDQAFTAIAAATDRGTTEHVRWWRLFAPAIETANVEFAFSAAPIAVVTVYAVKGRKLNDEFATLGATGTLDPVTVGITTEADDLVLDGAYLDDDTVTAPTAGAGQTARTNVTVNINDHGMSSEERAAGTTTTMSWTSASVVTGWATQALRIKKLGTAAAPVVLTKAVAAPAQGVYRVYGLIRNPDAANLGVRMGYAYGGVTVDPDTARDYLDIPTTDTGWQWRDLGPLRVPPDDTPDGATVGTITLRLAAYAKSIVGDSRLDCDAVKLMTLGDSGEQGGAVAKTSAQEVVVMDSLSQRTPGVYLWDTGNVLLSRPEYTGSPFPVHQSGSRVFVQVNRTASSPVTDGGKVAVVIQRRHLQVA